MKKRIFGLFFLLIAVILAVYVGTWKFCIQSILQIVQIAETSGNFKNCLNSIFNLLILFPVSELFAVFFAAIGHFIFNDHS